MGSKTHAGGEDLFFRQLVDSYVSDPHFLARDWLSEAVDRHLQDSDCRFVLITAEPGAGKSTFMAQLARAHPDWLSYFIRRDQQEPLSDVGAHSFLMRLGFQFAVNHPALFEPDTVKVTIRQRVENAEQGSNVVGAEIDRLMASPFYPSLIQIQQDITRHKGNVVGVRVGEYVQDPHLIPVEDLQHMALLDPARALLQQNPGKIQVILVDALDEIRYQRTDGNLLEWLTNAPELPDNLRFVLTSRPTNGLLDLFCARQSSRLCRLDFSDFDERLREDSKTYVNKAIRQVISAQAVSESGAANDFAKRVLARAEGNIGYLGAIARQLERFAFGATHEKDENKRRDYLEELDRLLALQVLPEKLEGLYAYFLSQTEESLKCMGVPVGRDFETGEELYRSVWAVIYRPILGVLSVAFAPLDIEEIKSFGNIPGDTAEVADALGRLSQFLDRVGDRYRLYHSTLADFLVDESPGKAGKNATLRVASGKWHEMIVHSIRDGHPTWAEVDWAEVSDYGLGYIARHLGKLDDSCGETGLDQLICGSLMKAKLERFRSQMPFQHDVELAIEAAREDNSSNGLLRLMRSVLVFVNLKSEFSPGSQELIIVLAVAGDDEQLRLALDYANLITDANDRAVTLFEIGRYLFKAGKREAGEDVFKLAVEATGFIGEGRYKLGKANLISRYSLWLASLGLESIALDLGNRAVDVVEKLPGGKVFVPTVLNQVAESRFLAGDTGGAESLLEQASEIIHGMEDEESLGLRLSLMGERVAALSRLGRWDAIDSEIEIATEIATPGFYRSSAFASIVVGLLRASDKHSAAQRIEVLMQWRPHLEQRSEVWADLATAAGILAAGGQLDYALEVARELISVAQSESDQHDKESIAAATACALFASADQHALDLGFTAANMIDDHYAKTNTLVDVANALTTDNLPYLLENLEKALDPLPAGQQVLAWTRLARVAETSDQHLSQGLYQKASECLASVDDNRLKENLSDYLRHVRHGPAVDTAERAARQLRTTQRLVNDRQKAQALVTIAETLAERGFIQEAKAVLDEAGEAAVSNQYWHTRTEGLVTVAHAMARVGHLSGIASLVGSIETITEPSYKANVLIALAEAYFEVGEIGSAKRYVTEASREALKEVAKDSLLALVDYSLEPFNSLPVDLISVSMLHEFLDSICAVEDASNRAKGLIHLAQPLAQVGDGDGLDRLLEIASEFDNEKLRADLVCAVALACDDFTESRWVDRCLTLIKAVQNEENLAEALETLAPVLAGRHGRPHLNDIAHRLSGLRDGPAAARVLAVLVIPFIRAGQEDLGRSLSRDAVDEMLRLLEYGCSLHGGAADAEITREDQRAADYIENSAIEVILTLGQGELPDLMSETVQKAVPMLRDSACERLITALAVDLPSASESQYTLTLLDVLVESGRKIDDKSYRFRALFSVLEKLVLFDQIDSAEEIAEVVAKLARRCESANARSEQLAMIASCLVNLGKTDAALKLFSEALDYARAATREEVYKVASKVISIIDDADCLQRIYRDLIDIDNWWDFEMAEFSSGFSRGVMDRLGRRDYL